MMTLLRRANNNDLHFFFLNATYARDILFDVSFKICSSLPDLKPFLPLFLSTKKKEYDLIDVV